MLERKAELHKREIKSQLCDRVAARAPDGVSDSLGSVFARLLSTMYIHYY